MPKVSPTAQAQPLRCNLAGMAKKRGEKLTVPQVAERLGIRASAWRGYVSRSRAARAAGRVTPSLAPLPDGEYDGRTPWWWESTIAEWQGRRRGHGWRASGEK